MRQLVVVTGRHPTFTAARAYETLRDLDSFMTHSPAVRNVTLEETPDGRTISHWEVNFRNGILVWSEEDVFDDATHSVRFHRLEGDPEYFAGTWSATDEDDGCHVRFEAEFDIGIPTLSAMLDPLASSTLRDNIVQTMVGVMGDDLVLDPEVEIKDVPVAGGSRS
ncbi:MAG TPA: SRPBCC family protein [Thermoleophilaceae bacterium]|jgi:ribosome-associated toxin RatA of RatAB toxin-antitoxin module